MILCMLGLHAWSLDVPWHSVAQLESECVVYCCRWCGEQKLGRGWSVPLELAITTDAEKGAK